MNSIYLLIDRLKEKLASYYRKKIFLSKIKGAGHCVTILGKIYVNASNIEIGNNVTIYPNVYFWGSGKISIGNNVDIGVGTVIFSKHNVTIGNDVSIAGQCYIIDSNHSSNLGILIRSQDLDFEDDGIIIGNDVLISAGCKIIKGAKINHGAVIGAMSLVNSEIDENSIAYGIPARVKKYRK